MAESMTETERRQAINKLVHLQRQHLKPSVVEHAERSNSREQHAAKALDIEQQLGKLRSGIVNNTPEVSAILDARGALHNALIIAQGSRDDLAGITAELKENVAKLESATSEYIALLESKAGIQF